MNTYILKHKTTNSQLSIDAINFDELHTIVANRKLNANNWVIVDLFSKVV